jgi:hypothetical protein
MLSVKWPLVFCLIIGSEPVATVWKQRLYRLAFNAVPFKFLSSQYAMERSLHGASRLKASPFTSREWNPIWATGSCEYDMRVGFQEADTK